MSYRVSDPDMIASRGVSTSPLDASRKPAALSEPELAFVAEKRAAGVPDRAIANMLGRSINSLTGKGSRC